MMKLHFEPNLEYQRRAIDAACDLFRGQEICRTEFTVTPAAISSQLALAYAPNDLGIGNRLTLPDDEILRNLQAVQLRSGLLPDSDLRSGDFTVEMETGTGKTYVYLRTIFELNKHYGFTKFVIVVPSVAIKEGVYKTLQITEDHFRGLYAGAPFEYFLYDSNKLGQVRNFAASPHIQIMVVTVGAINKKDVNNLYKDSEKTGGEKPIDLIRATRPIVIVDEPQSVDGGLTGAGKAALDAMNPLCTLRYSATHADKHHMIYRLDAVDAYEGKLVKQIEVASATVEGAHNRPYVRLIAVSNKRSTLSAKVELDVSTAAGAVQRKTVNVEDGSLLELVTGRAVYRDCRIGEIRAAKGREFMELHAPGVQLFLKLGKAYGDVDEGSVQRQMIRRTIQEHLDKEMRLRPQGIKVLSLFFIDEVAKYRQYDADGSPLKGPYARIFEEEYARFMRHPDYRTLFEEIDFRHDPAAVHNGYFSIDKRGGWSDTDDNNQTNRENAERAYNLIMRDKERLLSLETPLKFIFSHSALKEGWDNPNVFQICTLRNIQTERERRQTIGRGLRLCVNQDGERQRGFAINTLTVIATEHYQDFAENLQKEIEAETGIRFGVVEDYQFAAIAVADGEGSPAPLGAEQARAGWEHLRRSGYINAEGEVQDRLKAALKAGALTLPAEFEAQRAQITEILRKLSGRLEIKNADERRVVRPRQAVLDDPRFKELWERIKYKTTFRVHFDNQDLIDQCTAALRDAPPIPKTRLQWRKADLTIGKSGVEAEETESSAPVILEETDIELPDLLTELQDRTQLTRRSIQRILAGSGRLDDFKRNPQQFIELAAGAINRRKRVAIVDGVKYQRLGQEYYYAQELFEQQELTGYLKNMLENTQKSVYEHVVYDSETEAAFARDMETNRNVKLYAKLPGWFTVPTPLGRYNPDWAVLIEGDDGGERLYLVVETKGGLFPDAMREQEHAKTACGKAHFNALREADPALKYIIASTLSDVFTAIQQGE